MFENFLYGIYFILIFIYQISKNMTILTLLFTYYDEVKYRGVVIHFKIVLKIVVKPENLTLF